MNTKKDIVVRRWTIDDNVTEITSILHKAYAQLADLGFRYYATWQGDDVTLQRLSSGISYLALYGDQIVGTITLRVPPDVSGCSWYDRGDVASFGQFGVDPDFQKHGIGSLLLNMVENETKKLGIPNLALDTAEGADHLVKLYRKKGYQSVGFADWDVTNYRSIILNKALY